MTATEMPSEVAILIPTRGKWLLHQPGGRVREIDPRAVQLPGRTLAVDGLSRRCAVFIALASTDCFSATLSTKGLPRSGRTRALTYQFESFLPIAAEDVTARFMGDGEEVLGVATERTLLAGLTWKIRAACPLVLLAAGGGRGGGGRGGGERDVDLVVSECALGVDLLYFSNGHPVRWDTVPLDEIEPTLRLAGRSPATVAVQCSSPVAAAAVTRVFPAASVSSVPEDQLSAAFHTAARIAAGEIDAPLDLQPAGDSPAGPRRKSMITLAFAAVACLIMLTGACLIQVRKLEAESQRFELREQAAFRRAIPGQPVPLAPLARLESEARRLKASTAQAAPHRPAASALVSEALDSLPSATRFRLLELRFDAGQLTLEGQTRSHSDAALLAGALRSHFTVTAPQTEQTSPKSISFTLTATPLIEPIPGGGGAP